MLENRNHQRNLTLKTARISFGDVRAQIDCCILNLSAGGACILVPDGSEVAESFGLTIDGDDRLYSCTVAWRLGPRIGASFAIPPDELETQQSQRSPPSPHLRVEIERLRQENATLRALLKQRSEAGN